MDDRAKNTSIPQDILKLIVDQKKEIEELRRENKRLRDSNISSEKINYFLNVLDKGFVLIKENQIIDCNDKFVNILGYYDKTEVVGKMPFELPLQNDFIERLYEHNRPFRQNGYNEVAFKCKYTDKDLSEGLLHVDIVSNNSNNVFTAYVFISVIKTYNERISGSHITLNNQYSFIHGHMSTNKPKSVQVIIEADTGEIKYVNPYTYECLNNVEDLVGKKIYNCQLAKQLPLFAVIFSNFESCRDKAFPIAKSTDECEINHGIVTSSKINIDGKDYIEIKTTDNTKNIRQIDRLRKSEKKFIDIFNNLNDAIYIHSYNINEKSKFMDVNNVTCNRLGYSKEELLDMPIANILTEEGASKIPERMKELGDKDQLFFESEQIGKHGDIIPVEINARRVKLFGEDIIISVARDITRRKWIENFLMQSEERNRRLVELLPNPVVLTKDGCVVYANSAAKAFMAIEEKEPLIGRKLSQIFTAINQNSARIMDKVINDTIDDNTVFEELKLLRLKDQVAIDIELTTSMFKYSNKQVKVLHFRDLKHIKKSEKYERLFSDAVRYDTLKTLFFANLSHEFKTPLNVMLSAIQVLIGIIDVEDKNYSSVNMISNKLKINCYRLLRLVNNLIDLTKFDSGFYDMHSENCNIVSLVENICDYSMEVVKEQGIKLVFDTDCEEIIIACDPYKIDRILLNLLSNAIKFTEHGGTIGVKIESFDDYVEISISDDGIGIPKEMLTLIFKHFNQIDKSFTRKNEGCGIGLTLVKYLVQMHNGSISVNSEVGKGSEFKIRLPITVGEVQEASVVEDREITYHNTIDIEFSDIYTS